MFANIYRYRLAEGAGQHPLLVSDHGKLIGSGSDGTIFVQRDDGIWQLSPRRARVDARLVAGAAVPANSFTIAGKTAYLGLVDGRLIGIALATGRTIFDAHPGIVARVAVTSESVYAVCSGSAWHVAAFAKPKE